jgi:hypothetical protein
MSASSSADTEWDIAHFEAETGDIYVEKQKMQQICFSVTHNPVYNTRRLGGSWTSLCDRCGCNPSIDGPDGKPYIRLQPLKEHLRTSNTPSPLLNNLLQYFDHLDNKTNSNGGASDFIMQRGTEMIVGFLNPGATAYSIGLGMASTALMHDGMTMFPANANNNSSSNNSSSSSSPNNSFSSSNGGKNTFSSFTNTNQSTSDSSIISCH